MSYKKDFDRRAGESWVRTQDGGTGRDIRNPIPVTRGQMTALIGLIVVIALVAVRMHVSDQEAEAVRTGNKSLCWTHGCEVNVAVARLRS